MKIDKDTLQQLINDKLITVKQSTNYPMLSVIKYTRRVFYDALWDKNPLLKDARGLIIDSDYNVVVRPFEKVFNRGETQDADIHGDSHVLCVHKMNGFLGVVTFHKDYGWLYSTTGSLDSPYVDLIRDYIQPIEVDLSEVHGITYLFEICHPSDPHIVQETHGAYWIGLRHPSGTMADESALDIYVDEINGVMRPKSFVCKMREVNEHLKSCRHEGFMVHELNELTQTGKIIKMKSPFYLLRKMIARKKDLDKALNNSKLVKEKIEEELYCIVDAVVANKELVQNMDEQKRLQFMTDVLLKEQK